eukprot:3939063-Rhodomonas_salina.3
MGLVHPLSVPDTSQHDRPTSSSNNKHQSQTSSHHHRATSSNIIAQHCPDIRARHRAALEAGARTVGGEAVNVELLARDFVEQDQLLHHLVRRPGADRVQEVAKLPTKTHTHARAQTHTHNQRDAHKHTRPGSHDLGTYTQNPTRTDHALIPKQSQTRDSTQRTPNQEHEATLNGFHSLL